ncbi:MAG: carbohydrate kinase family protein [Chloroflexi bacterium]|nr:carbohydrate kinase family protein [Chloroflexota bacterium]
MARSPEVVVIGAACVDIKAWGRGGFVATTSNPGSVRVERGGVARNIAENLGRLGVRTTLLTAVGLHDFGLQLLERTAGTGVDVSRALHSPNHHTAAYVALLDDRGELIAAIDDTDIIGLLTPRYIRGQAEIIADASMVIIDANLRLPAVSAICKVTRRLRVPLALEPVSYPLARRIRGKIGNMALVTPNIVEAEALTGGQIGSLGDAARAAKGLVGMGAETAVITLERAGAVYATGSAIGHVPAIECQVVDATGAGDAMAAGIIYGMVNNVPVDEAVRLGVSAATLTLQSSETVSSELTLEHLYARMPV